jgi:hypothetical protein
MKPRATRAQKAFLLLTITLLMALPSSVWSASSNRCSALFNIQPEAPLRLMGLLNQRKLEAQGFKVDGADNLIDLKTMKKVGRLLTVNPPYLYEWADLDYQKIWVYNGGLSEADVDVYLRSPPQNYGRGYYVSTSPYDSTTFGDALTVFRTDGPLLLINYEYGLKNAPPRFMRRLRDAGIDGIRGHQTWYAMINGKHLKIARGQIDDPQLLEQSSAAFATRIAKSGWLQQLPPASPALQAAKLRTVEGFKDALKSPDESVLNSLMGVLRSLPNSPLPKLLEPTDKFSLRNVFPFFEMASLHQILKRKTSDIPDLAAVAEATRLQLAKRARIDLEKVQSLQDFAQLAPIYLGQNSEIREAAATMSSPYSPSTQPGMKLVSPVIRFKLLSQRSITYKENLRTKRASIEYLNLGKIHQHLRLHLPPLLRARLEALAQKYDLNDPRILNDKDARLVLRESLEHLTNLLFSDVNNELREMLQSLFGHGLLLSEIEPYLLYRAFILIHPFTEGNGRLGRLYFEWASMKRTGKRSVLELADFDVDVVMNSKDLKELHDWTRLWNAWIAQAQNEKELLRRIEIAMDSLQRQFTLLNAYWMTERDR